MVVACLLAAAMPSISSVVVAGVSAVPAVEDPPAAPVSQTRVVRALRADLVVDVGNTAEFVTSADTSFSTFAVAAFGITTREGPSPPLRGPPALY